MCGLPGALCPMNLFSPTFTLSALTKWADSSLIPLYVLHRGDPDRGLILIHGQGLDHMSVLWVQGSDSAGNVGWRKRFPAAISQSEASSYIDRERKRDEDLWVIELENHPDLPPILPVLANT